MTNMAEHRQTRPTIAAHRHVAAAGHYWTAQAGFQIMEAGGNAIDAGVAMGIATAVLESEFVGFGGVAPTMIYLAETREIVVISGVGPWPMAATTDFFRERFGGRVPPGILNTVVPAAPAIWIAALERYGTLSFGEVAASAIRFARDGFPMYPMFRGRLIDHRGEFAQWPETAAIFLPGGRIPDEGAIFVQSDLAATLQYLADEESAHRGENRRAGLQAARDAFYKGDIAARMVRQQEDMGGLMTAADLASFRARFEKPCRARFGDVEVYGCGPWSQGPLVLQALNILDGVDLGAMGHNGADYVHTVTEALKLAAADREAYFGDPDFVDVPMDRLLSAGYAAERRRMIRRTEAWPGMPPFGKLPGYGLPAWRPDPSARSYDPAERESPALETSHLAAADRFGNLFAATPSDPTISGPVTPGAGITPSMWGSRAYTDPRHPAAIGPGRRPRMSANPMIAIRAGRSVASFGSPGSEVLGQAQLQAFLNVFVFGMTPQAAVEAPRFASYSWPASAIPHSYHPGRLNLEADIGEAVGADLAARGHKIEWWPKQKWSAGSVCSVGIDAVTGLRYGAADPRRTAYAVGW